MSTCRSLLLTWVLLAARVQSWRACTDLLPLDLLARALPRPGQAPTTQVQVVWSKGFRGIQLAAAATVALSFPASQIFSNCDDFPAEFSLVATVMIPKLRPKRSEFVLSVMDQRSDRLLLGLGVSRNRLHFVTASSGASGRGRLTFKGVGLDDNHWHTLVLAITGPYATLTVDCGRPLELEQIQAFPSTLSTRGFWFFVGSRRRRRGHFSGLLRQLVLLPGSDATPRLCPPSGHSQAELSVPQVLQSPPLQPSHQGYPYVFDVCCYDNSADQYRGPEATVTLGNRPVCSRAERGRLWLNTQRTGLFVCDGLTWRTLLQSPERLDYLEDYQDLYTSSETFDMEVFSIPSEGLFMAAANRDSLSGSSLYRWRNGSFQLHQNMSTQEARAWKHFTVDDKIFLVVANSREAEPELSIIYRWSRRQQRFLRYQTLETHGALDWEAFKILNHSFLVVANHRRARDSNHNIQSVIYRWSPDTKLFEVYQTLSTSGAYDWEFFTVGPYHFLVVANTFDGQTTTISSTVYVWLDGHFQTFQNIPTVGATDWETFQIDGRFFLAVANSQKISDRGRGPYSINSTVYELSALTHTFIRFQDILTHSAVDWEFFTIGDEKFLVVANSYDGHSHSLNSVVYRWQGYEGFVPVHSLPTFGCRDWEHFSTTEGSFLVYSSATSRLSKVFRLRTY